MFPSEQAEGGLVLRRSRARAAQERNLFKMDTIGDAYIVAALLPPPGPGSVSAAARVCLDLEARNFPRRCRGGALYLKSTMFF